MDVKTQLADVVDELDAPVATASDVASKSDLGRRTVLEKLKAYSEAGLVGSRKVGAAGRVFWPLEERDDRRDQEESDDDQEAGDVDRDEDVVDDQDEGSAETIAPTGLDAVDFPSTKDRKECERAVLAARDYLRDEGPASMRELVLEVMPEVSIGYEPPESLEEGERYRGGWWRSVVRPGLSELDDVEKPSGGGQWRYVV